MPTSAQTVGQRIALLRRAHGLTQQALGEPLCRAGDIAVFESGHQQPPNELLRLLANRLSCPVPYLTDGVPAKIQHHIDTAFTVAEQVFLRSDASAALERYTRLRSATTILLGRRTEADIGAALAHEANGEYSDAFSALKRASSHLPVGKPQWTISQAAMIRCRRLAGDPDSAENTADAARLEIQKEAHETAGPASVLIDTQLLAVYADRGDHPKTRRLATHLAHQLENIPPEIEYGAYHSLAYAAITTGDAEAALSWVFNAYRIGSAYSLEPPARLIVDCIRRLEAVPHAETAAAAIAELRRRATARGLSPDSSAHRFVRQVRAMLEAGMVAEALEDCDALLGAVIGASLKASREVIAAYGEVLAATGLRPDEAEVPLREASDLLQNRPFLTANGAHRSQLDMLVATEIAADWMRQALSSAFSAPSGRSPYDPPQEPPAVREHRRF
ncbi:hypothetical protein [Actinoallomurus sp. NPDC050550]|uniref:helix-turn-helix domain-containing protein n=1 Tax=Actinoallomurus sp. NPDC050550 TaxID=3154937 RepID=UPI0033C50FEA